MKAVRFCFFICALTKRKKPSPANTHTKKTEKETFGSLLAILVTNPSNKSELTMTMGINNNRLTYASLNSYSNKIKKQKCSLSAESHTQHGHALQSPHFREVITLLFYSFVFLFLFFTTIPPALYKVCSGINGLHICKIHTHDYENTVHKMLYIQIAVC